jgi:NhaA family Na+:H+ antiporter
LLVEEAKIGILLGSLLSAIAGYVLLRFAPRHPSHSEEEARQGDGIGRDAGVGGLEEESSSTPLPRG